MTEVTCVATVSMSSQVPKLGSVGLLAANMEGKVIGHIDAALLPSWQQDRACFVVCHVTVTSRECDVRQV